MAKKTNDNYVNHQEILNCAIMFMSAKCEHHVELCGGDLSKAKECFPFYFIKLRRMCEMYEIETGEPYELRAGCSLELSDLY